ncbi:ubiquitin carboxyl-terminal hydrolase 22 [Lasallia pustulata]|uniref:ubiquitinyl hydrolase 1 n=1 Tax=Lasallia pustulata TaxID=136370 RepID=A0A1W5D2N4_9LECA|nr:ubiquitin carboxyl-terminal hydrolase 22 [Lasallia pustulata]
MLNRDADSKKRKFSAISRQTDDPSFLQANLSMPSCLAGAPRGLYNLGQSCYMSVILQAMIHNPLMRNYFLAGRHNSTECTRSPCLACALNDSFSDILTTDKIEGHGPVSLLHKSWLCHPDLAGYRQQDAHEYFQFMLDQLHQMSVCAEEKDSSLQERNDGRRPLHRPKPGPAPPSKAKKDRCRPPEQRGTPRVDRLSSKLHQL